MDQQTKLVIFQAQVANVRSLRSAMRQAHRSINEGLRDRNQPKIDAFTRAYALMFCAWAEANFSKVLHTPYGFEIDEIGQNSIRESKWYSGDLEKMCRARY